MSLHLGFFKKKHETVPLEDFAVRRRRELLADLDLYDGALRSLSDDLRIERTRAGLAVHQELPTSLKGPRMQALQLGLAQLSHWHSETLRELASLS